MINRARSGRPERIGVGLPERGLDRPHEVVAEEPDRAPGERRQAVELGDLVAGQVGGHRAVWIVLAPGGGGWAAGGGALAAPLAPLSAGPAQLRAGPEAQERVAPQPSPLLGRLEQERGSVSAQLQVGGDRGLGVVDEGVADRDDVGGARELASLLEARFEVR